MAASRGPDLLVGVRERRRGVAGWQTRGARPPTEVDDHGWRTLIAELADWPLRSVTLQATTDGVTVQSGPNGCAPLYLVGNRRGLWTHWDPGQLYRRISLDSPLDTPLASLFLAAFDVPYSHRTLIGELHLLTEGCHAAWRAEDGHLEFRYPPAVGVPAEGTLRPGADVVDGVWRCLISTMRRWPDHDAMGSELSSGLDSALTTAALVACEQETPVRTYAMALPPPGGDVQAARRAHLVSHFGSLDTALPMAGHEPFVPHGARALGVPVLPWEECYIEAADAMLATAAADGVRVMVTGFGGDELCYPRRGGIPGGPYRHRPPASEAVPGHLTALAREALQDVPTSADPAPPGVALISAVQVAATSSARYLRHGIWPVLPLAAPEIVRLCARLPRPWLRDRRLSRELLSRVGVGPNVAYAPDTDTFEPVMARGLRQAWPRWLSGLWDDSRLADLGLIDPARFRTDFAGWAASGAADGTVPFYATIQLELTLRSLDAHAAGAADAAPPR
jgi:asparagine synthase (glutamine-hydrolysing)